MQFHVVHSNTHPIQDIYLPSVISIGWQIPWVSACSSLDPVQGVACVFSCEPNGHVDFSGRGFSLVGTSGLQQNEQPHVPLCFKVLATDSVWHS